MSEYIVKIGFWLRAYDGFTVDANSDSEAIEKAKTAAKTAMGSGAYPEHIEIEERREGVIAFIVRVTPQGCRVVTEDVEFDDDRIHNAPAAYSRLTAILEAWRASLRHLHSRARRNGYRVHGLPPLGRRQLLRRLTCFRPKPCRTHRPPDPGAPRPV